MKSKKIGQPGLGMMGACSNIGRSFTPTTTRSDSNLGYTVKYNEEQWFDKRSKNWTNYKIIQSEKKQRWRCTIIIIGELRILPHQNHLLNFVKRFGTRYGPYLRNGQIKITINSQECKPIKPKLSRGTKRKINMHLPSGDRIKGRIGLLKKRSVKEDYGIHLINKDRLIKAYEKFGITHHPKAKKIIGELSLDHVPVNSHKTGFLKYSTECIEAEKHFRTNQTVLKILDSSFPQTRTSEIQSVLNHGQGVSAPVNTQISN